MRADRFVDDEHFVESIPRFSSRFLKTRPRHKQGHEVRKTNFPNTHVLPTPFRQMDGLFR